MTVTISTAGELNFNSLLELHTVDGSHVRDRLFALCGTHGADRICEARRRAFRRNHLDGISIDSSRLEVLSRCGVPGSTTGTLNLGRKLHVLIVNRVFRIGFHDPLDEPRDRTVRIGPAPLYIFGGSIFVVNAAAVIVAHAVAIGVTKEIWRGLTIQSDFTRGLTDGVISDSSLRPPVTGDVTQTDRGLRDSIDAARELSVINHAVTDLLTRIEGERKISIPRDEISSFDDEILADGELIALPRTAHRDDRRGLATRRGDLGDFSGHAGIVGVCKSRRDHTPDYNSPDTERCENSLHDDVPFRCVKAYNPCLGYR